MVNCENCQTLITRTRPAVFCEVCKKSVHSTCISKIDILPAINNTPGLTWKCDECIRTCIVINQADILKMLDGKIEEVVAAIKKHVSSISEGISRSIRYSHNSTEDNQPVKYADVVKNKTKPALIIQPKNANQEVDKTKSDILSNANPAEAEVQLTRVRNVRDGGILIGCKSQEENRKLKAMVQEKLSDNYEVREVTGVYPRIKLVGMNCKYSEETLKNLILRGNPSLFSDSGDFKIIKHFPTKKNDKIFQAIIQVDKISYEKSMRAGHLFVGLDSCSIFDAIEIYRCFKCNEFHHSSNRCTKAVVCPLCSENHELKQCKSQIRKCTNCSRLHLKDQSVAVDHAVWEKEKCLAYNNSLEHDFELFPQTYSVYRSDRDFSSTSCMRGGGVLIAVAEHLSSTRVELDGDKSLSQLRIDVVVVKVKSVAGSICIVNLYIPPDTPNSDYEILFDTLLASSFLFDNNHILIVGDFNLMNYANYMITGVKGVDTLEGFGTKRSGDILELPSVISMPDELLESFIASEVLPLELSLPIIPGILSS
nr:unnamed protein product [Callosobruchus analis]